MKKQTLSSLLKEISAIVKEKGIRAIGNPNLEISRIALVPGMAPTLQMHLGPLQRDDVDAVLVGEGREWEDYVYTRDAVLQGRKKAAIFIGHLKSEEPGMQYCAEWLKGFLSGIRVIFWRNPISGGRPNNEAFNSFFIDTDK